MAIYRRHCKYLCGRPNFCFFFLTEATRYTGKADYFVLHCKHLIMIGSASEYGNRAQNRENSSFVRSIFTLHLIC